MEHELSSWLSESAKILGMGPVKTKTRYRENKPEKKRLMDPNKTLTNLMSNNGLPMTTVSSIGF